MRLFVFTGLVLLKEVAKVFLIVGLIVALVTGLPIPWWEFTIQLFFGIFTTWILLQVIALTELDP